MLESVSPGHEVLWKPQLLPALPLSWIAQICLSCMQEGGAPHWSHPSQMAEGRPAHALGKGEASLYALAMSSWLQEKAPPAKLINRPYFHLFSVQQASPVSLEVLLHWVLLHILVEKNHRDNHLVHALVDIILHAPCAMWSTAHLIHINWLQLWTSTSHSPKDLVTVGGSW